MTRFLQKIKKLNNIKFWMKIAIVLLVSCISFLLILNQNAISFSINGFGKVLQNQLQVYFFDVGQASSTLLILPNKQCMLIDTGTQEGSLDLVQNVAWVLRKNKLDGLDFLVLTHSDADHVGGTAAIAETFEIGCAIRPKLLAPCETSLLVENDFPIIYTNAYNNAMKALSMENCQIQFVENMLFQQEEFSLQFFACENAGSTETNYHSPFIVLESFNRTFMFTGDVTAAREKEFLKSMEAFQQNFEVDFLQVAHHGSKYSSTQQFLDAIHPKYAFFSAGDETHPTQEVKNRLKNAGTQKQFVTKQDGTIAVAINKDGNFFVCTSRVFTEIPCLVVVFSLAGFVAIFLLDRSNLAKRQVFSVDKFNKKFV